MRTSVGYGNLWETYFSINDRQVISFYDSGYSWIHLKPGQYKISVGTSLNSNYLNFMMPVKAGKQYFIEYGQESAGYNTFRNFVRAIPPTHGREKVKGYSFKAADKVHLPASVEKPNK